MQFQTLQTQNFHQLHQCFCEAFSDYKLKMQPTETELKMRAHRIGMSYPASGGVFYEEKMIAFIMNAVGEFNGKLTAYNGGTGVIPSQRGQKLGAELYEFLFPKLKEQGIKQLLLEVISDNAPAIQLYEKLGFERTQTLTCFAYLSSTFPKEKSSLPIQISKIETPDWTKYQTLVGSTYICWQNQLESVSRDLNQEIILEVYHKTETIGFAIFNPQNGKISQMAVSEEYRNKKVGHNLMRAIHGLSANKKMSILNISQSDTQAMVFLQKIGFSVAVEQFEMVRIVGSYQ